MDQKHSESIQKHFVAPFSCSHNARERHSFDCCPCNSDDPGSLHHSRSANRPNHLNLSVVDQNQALSHPKSRGLCPVRYKGPVTCIQVTIYDLRVSWDGPEWIFKISNTARTPRHVLHAHSKCLPAGSRATTHISCLESFG